MAVIVSEGFNVVAPFEIDRRMIVDSVDTTPNSLINLEINYNYTNMIVWVRDEKAFYYLIDSPTAGGAVASDWTKLETGGGGAGATACGKAGYVSGNSFVGSVPGPATASVTFETPYQSASYSVSITGLTNDNTSGYPDYIYSVIDRTPSGFTIQVNTTGPIGATAMWITNCWDGSGLSNGGGFLPEGKTASVPYFYNGAWQLKSTQIYNDGLRVAINGGNLGANGTPKSFDPTNSAEFTVGGSSCVAVIESKSSGYVRLLEGKNWTNLGAITVMGIYATMAGEYLDGITLGVLNSTAKTSGYGNPRDVFIYGGSKVNSLNFINQFDGAPLDFRDKTFDFYVNRDATSVPVVRMFSPEGLTQGIIITNGSELRYGDKSTCNSQQNGTTDETSGYYVITKAPSTLEERWTLVWPKQGPASYSTTVNTALTYDVASSEYIWATAGSGGSGNAINSEEIAFGTGTGITSSEFLTFDSSNCNLISSNGLISDTKKSVSLGGSANKIFKSDNSGIILGSSNFIYDSFSSIVLGGRGNTLGTSSVAQKISATPIDNAILSGVRNQITGVSRSSGIMSGYFNSLTASNRSVILGGFINCIDGSYNSGIISSSQSLILDSRGSNIFGSAYSCIENSRYSSILSSTSSQILNFSFSTNNNISCRSLIIGGQNNIIKGVCNSAIIGGCNICLYKIPNPTPIVNDNSQINNVVAVPSLIGNGSLSLSIMTASTTTSLNDCYFTLIAYPPEPSGTMDVCLPRANAIGRMYIIKKNGSGTNSIVRICPHGIFPTVNQCIDGYQGYVELTNPWDYLMLQADGVDNWIKLGGAVGLNL